LKRTTKYMDQGEGEDWFFGLVGSRNPIKSIERGGTENHTLFRVTSYRSHSFQKMTIRFSAKPGHAKKKPEVVARTRGPRKN